MLTDITDADERLTPEWKRTLEILDMHTTSVNTVQSYLLVLKVSEEAK